MGYSSKELKRMGFDDIEPIKRTKMGNKPTWYGDTLYRSKLESRFACMLDYWVEYKILGSWEYEPESLIMEHTDSHGKRRDIEYIYDFYLTGYEGDNWVVEIKGPLQQYDLLKWELFTQNYEEKFMAVFASTLMPQNNYTVMGMKKDPARRKRWTKGKVSRTKYNKMLRICDRLWENVNAEFKRYAMTEITDDDGKPRILKGR